MQKRDVVVEGGGVKVVVDIVGEELRREAVDVRRVRNREGKPTMAASWDCSIFRVRQQGSEVAAAVSMNSNDAKKSPYIWSKESPESPNHIVDIAIPRRHLLLLPVRG